MNLNNENCHNFSMAEKLGHCPFISVCNSDCVYVWKALYDNRLEHECEQDDIDELKEKISDLQGEIYSLEESKNIAQGEAEDWEIKYNEMVNDLAKVMNNDSIDKLCNYRDDGKVGEWAEDVCSRRMEV
jgi:predicted nuclease with TOPRIM domain